MINQQFLRTVLIVLSLAWAPVCFAQMVGDFKTAGSGAWTTASTWFTYNGSAYVPAGAAPNNTAQNVIISAGDAVTLNTAQTITQLTVQSGASLTQTAGIITLGGSVVVDGTFTINNSLICGTWVVGGVGSFNLASGATLNIGSSAGITASGATGNIQTTTRTFSTGANYTYTSASVQVTGNGLPTGITGTITVANTHTGSGLTLSAPVTVTAPGSFVVPLGGVLTCPNSINILGTGSFSLAAGATLFVGANLGISNTVNTGNVQVTGGKFFSAAANYTYFGTVLQNTGSALPSGLTGTVTFANTHGAGTSLTTNLVITAPGVVNVTGNLATGTNNISGTGDFNLNPSAFFLIGHPDGIDPGTAIGALRVSGTRTLPTAANYTYYGSPTQVTGAGLPTMVTSLYINSPGGTVNLSANTTLNGSLTLNNGTFCLNGNTFTVTNGRTISRNGGLLLECGGTLNFLGTVSVTYTGSGSLTTGLEIPPNPAALIDLTLNGVGKVVTLGRDVTINNALTMTAGSLALGGYQLNYSPSAKLVYNGPAAQTTGVEWPDAGFDKPIEIRNTFAAIGVALNMDKSGYSGSFTVFSGGYFNSGGYSLSGTGNIAVNSGGTYITPHPAGVNTTGAILLTGTRTFATNSSYHFNGTAAQVTGAEMPISITNLTANNNAGVTLTNAAALTLNGTLALTAGVFDVTASNAALTFQNGAVPCTRGTGSITIPANTSLQFGTVGNLGGAAAVLPNDMFTTAPTVVNFGMNRTNALALGNQPISITNTLTLTAGLLDVGSGTLIFHSGNTPIVRTGATLSMGGSGTLQFGAAGATGGAAFTLPNGLFSAAPTFSTLTVNRNNPLTLGNQNITLNNALNLVAGNLSIGATTLGLNGLLNITAGTLTGGSTSSLSIGGGIAAFTVPAIINNLNSLIVARPNSGSVPSVGLGAALTLSGGLNLSGGSLALNNYNLTTAAIANHTALRYVVTTNSPSTGGYLVRTAGATAVVFPVGTGSYTPITVNNSGGTADAFRVRVFDGVLSGGTTGTTDANAVHSVNKTWLVEEAVAGGSNVTLTTQWNTANENISFARGSSYVAHHNGTEWDMTTTSTATAVSAGVWSQSRSGLTSFSPFSVQDNLIVLPLKWTDFTATKTTSGALLHWQVATEGAGTRYDVQRSADGNRFTVVGSVAGGSVGGHYSHPDPTTISGTVYYRIKATTADGHAVYSMVRKLNTGLQILQVYPLPATNVAHLQYRTGSAGSCSWQLHDATGRLVQKGTTTVVQGMNTLSLPVTALTKGCYTVRISNAGEEAVVRLLK